MLSMNDLRQGVTILEGGDLWLILESEFMRKAQRRPVMRTKLRNVKTGAVKERTFKQGDSIPEADVGKTKARFLYAAGDTLTFMDETTYEQHTLSKDAVGAGASFLHEGMVVEIVTFEGAPIVAQLPIKMEAKVMSAPPGIRGDSATNIMKEVVLEGNAKVKAPLFVKEGDVIIVDTRTGEYVSKAG